MATFNLKPDKIRYNNSISTLDMKHNEKVCFFEKYLIDWQKIQHTDAQCTAMIFTKRFFIF